MSARRRDDERDDGHWPDRRDEGDAATATLDPSEHTFWQRYNPHLEFPTSWLIAVFALSLIAFVLVILIPNLVSHTDKKSVPIRLVDGGFDEAGDGSAGSGGVENPLAVGDTTPTMQDQKALTLPKELPEIKDEIRKDYQFDDPTANMPLPDEKAAAYGSLDKTLRDKLLGSKRGNNGGPGSGDTGQNGSRVGGTGADSTRARSLRWILRFRTASGRDYLDQLRALGAVVIVPLPPDNKQAYIFRDLANPKPGTPVSEPEWKQLAQQIQFCDYKRSSVVAVGEALGLNFTPTQFWAFFPKALEAKLDRLERGFRNRDPKDIEETIFQVVVRNGQYEMQVVDQKMKR
jgi:hypothetical protein